MNEQRKIDWLRRYPVWRREAIALLEQDRANNVASLLEAGWTYQKIADELNVTKAAVHLWAHPKGRTE